MTRCLPDPFRPVEGGFSVNVSSVSESAVGLVCGCNEVSDEPASRHCVVFYFPTVHQCSVIFFRGSLSKPWGRFFFSPISSFEDYLRIAPFFPQRFQGFGKYVF